jgi:hypothetical protein
VACRVAATVFVACCVAATVNELVYAQGQPNSPIQLLDRGEGLARVWTVAGADAVVRAGGTSDNKLHSLYPQQLSYIVTLVA